MFPTFHFDIERWKYNPTFELWVSTRGRIRNKSKADIAPKVMRNGYMSVRVHGSLNKNMLLHRVVMLTWRPTPEAEELTVDHLDHNKRNNALSNLEWVSLEENRRRAERDVIAVNEVEPALMPAKMKTPAELWKEKMATCTGWRVEASPTSSLVIQPFTIGVSFMERERASRELERIMTSSYKSNKLLTKFAAVMNGSTQRDYVEYCGIRFTAIFPN